MKEYYITYQQAVKFKKLGFDWKCTHFYYIMTKQFCDWSTYSADNYNTRKEKASAPRLDQAQSWLREKGIIVYTKPILKSVGDEELQDFKFILKGYRFHVIKLDNAHHLTSYDYPTDEEALSAGIEKALKLLKNERLSN